MSNDSIVAAIFDLTISGGMGGLDTVKEIRKYNATFPVFVVSGYTDDPVLKNPEGYGFTSSIPKPFLLQELFEMLEAHLQVSTR